MALNFTELPKIHFLNVHDPQVHSGEGVWRRDLARWLTFRKVNRFVLHNRAQVEAFRERYGLSSGRISVSHLGAYTLFREWIERDVSEEPRTVLFFGRLSRYKGLDVLYRAMPIVATQVSGVRLIVAGERNIGTSRQLRPFCRGMDESKFSAATSAIRNSPN